MNLKLTLLAATLTAFAAPTSFAAADDAHDPGAKSVIQKAEKAEAKKRRNALVVIEDEKGNRYQTILDFVFSIGATQSLISSPEATSTV